MKSKLVRNDETPEGKKRGGTLWPFGKKGRNASVNVCQLEAVE
jgi:hypothetical protein